MPRTARAGRAIPRIGRAITRAVEDRLSDALHERLTQRFIDRRTSLLMRHLRDEEHLELSLDEFRRGRARAASMSESSKASVSRPIRAPKAFMAARCARRR